MKVLTGILIFLAAFILGYALADYAKIPDRIYFVSVLKGTMAQKEKSREVVLTIPTPPQRVSYISKESPVEKMKELTLEAFISNWKSIQNTHREAFLLKLRQGEHLYHARLEGVRYDEEANMLILSTSPITKGSNIRRQTKEVIEDGTLNIYQVR